MTLKEDVDAATKAAGGRANQGLDNDGVWTTVVPVDDGSLLPVQARVATSGGSFSLLALLADLEDQEPDLLLTLLRRHAEADHTGGAAYAVVSEETGDVIAATYHWVLPAVTPQEFEDLLESFAGAVRVMRNDLADMGERGGAIRLLEGPSLESLAAAADQPGGGAARP